MRRLLIVTMLLAACPGCVIVVGSPLGLFGRDRAPLEEVEIDGEGRDKILVVDVSGVITEQPTSRAFGLVEEDSTVSRMEAELDKAADDERVRAVVVHVRSPGGGVTASDDLHRELVRFRDERKVPIVAALGGVAASGGYYLACAADRIVAHPTTVTGSIGVILLNLNVGGLLEKIGVRDATVKAGRYKDILSPLRPERPGERRIVQQVVNRLHDRFKDVVRDGRKLEGRRLTAVTDGRIFDAESALAAGLVDEIGDLDAAIAAAKKAAGLERARVVRYRRPGESADTLHARWQGPVDRQPWASEIELLRNAGPRFMYLWAPELGAP
jgi:protease-4